jgi:hypothetical protein
LLLASGRRFGQDFQQQRPLRALLLGPAAPLGLKKIMRMVVYYKYAAPLELRCNPERSRAVFRKMAHRSFKCFVFVSGAFAPETKTKDL